MSHPEETSTALVLVAKSMERLGEQLDAMQARMDARFDAGELRFASIETAQKGLAIDVGATKREIQAAFDQVNRRLDISNGRHDKNESAIAQLRDEDLVARTRQRQREEIRAAAFGLVRALDNKLVTTLVLLALVALGGVMGRNWPW